MKPKHWKQANPFDQLVVIFSSLEGHLSNFEDNIISAQQFIKIVKVSLKQIKILEPFLKSPETWNQ
jgi:hypothetical protein